MHAKQRPPAGPGAADADRRPKLAQCMRSHGVPSFPDHIHRFQRARFSTSLPPEISDAPASHTRKFEALLTRCARLVGTTLRSRSS